jgi:hypothetical protein
LNKAATHVDALVLVRLDVAVGTDEAVEVDAELHDAEGKESGAVKTAK